MEQGLGREKLWGKIFHNSLTDPLLKIKFKNI